MALGSRGEPSSHRELWHGLNGPFIPDDVLLYIFLLVRDADAEGRGTSHRAATQVCRQWRAPAIAYPALWTKITLTRYVQHAELAFDRTARMPVDLTIRRFMIDLDPVYTVLEAHAHRLRSLVLLEGQTTSISGRHVARRLLRVIATSTRLQSFFLVGGCIDRELVSAIDIHPALRSLSLVDCSFSEYPSNKTRVAPGSQLTHLHLSFPNPNVSRSVHWYDALELLSRMPFLRTLELRNIPLPGKFRIDDLAGAALDRLELLTASDVHPTVVRNLLKCLRLPLTVRIDVFEDGKPLSPSRVLELSELAFDVGADD